MCGAPGAPGLGLGEVRLHQLEDAELGGRQCLAARAAEGLVLQRDDHRGQTLLSAGLRFGTADVSYLRSESGAEALAAVAELELTDVTRIADIAAVRARFGDRAPVLVETTLLRRRATDKLGQLGASGWLFTDEALQQATAAPVALHRARRLAGHVVHDATCSIGTELAALHRSGVRAVGSDIDGVRLELARHNLATAPPLSPCAG